MQKILAVMGIFIVLIILASSFSPTHKSTLHLVDKDISLIVVDTAASRELGLSGRESLPENTAMLFIFDKPDKYGFWMKDMKFPIDIIWLDENYHIVHIESALSPSTFPNTFFPPTSTLFVLETKAHFTEENRLKVGDVMNLTLIK